MAQSLVEDTSPVSHPQHLAHPLDLPLMVAVLQADSQSSLLTFPESRQSPSAVIHVSGELSELSKRLCHENSTMTHIPEY